MIRCTAFIAKGERQSRRCDAPTNYACEHCGPRCIAHTWAGKSRYARRCRCGRDARLPQVAS